MSMSFRLRLFLTAAALVALVLSVVMATGWLRVMDFEMGRLDARLCSEARRVAVENFPPEELPRLESDLQEKLRLASAAQLLLQSVDSAGQRRLQSAHWSDIVTPQDLRWSAPADADNPPRPGRPGRRGDRAACALASLQSQGDTWRMARVESDGASGSVAANLIAPRSEIRNALLGALAVEVPIALALTALGAWLLAALTMKPLNRLREAMKAVTPTALDQRLAQAGEDREFRELIDAYNRMLDRLERSFLQASRFSADAAHELKTPLTILRGRLEQARRRALSEEAQDDLSELLDEVGRLSAITRKLLLLSQADAGKLELSLEQVDLSATLQDLVADAQMLVQERTLRFSIASGLTLRADAVLLRQLLNNLIGNCVRYCTVGGFIDVRAQRSAHAIEVVFANSSRPVAAAERARLFERFYRGDAARNRSTEGSGLGLSLALEIARAHHGTLKLLPSPEDQIQLQLVLPMD